MKMQLGKIFLSIVIAVTQAQSCPPCYPDQICINSTCTCDPSVFSNPDVPALIQRQKIVCDVQKFNLTISGCVGRTLILEGVPLPNSTCITGTPNSPNPGEAVYTFEYSPLNPQCDAQISINDTYVTYSTAVNFFAIPVNGVYLSNDVKVYYNCSYPLDMKTSLNVAINPVMSTTNISISGSGSYKVTMSLYKYSNYSAPYLVSDSPITLKVEDFLYLGVMVDGINQRFALRLDTCYATPTNNSNDPTKYLFIQNSCPVVGAASVTIVENGNSSSARVAVKVFKFVTSTQVFLHCNVSLCTKPCIPTCPSPKTASSDGSSDGTLTANIQIELNSDSDNLYGSAPAVFPWTWKLYPLLALLLMKLM